MVFQRLIDHNRQLTGFARSGAAIEPAPDGHSQRPESSRFQLNMSSNGRESANHIARLSRFHAVCASSQYLDACMLVVG